MSDTTPDPSATPPRGSHRGRRKTSSVVVPILMAVALVVLGFIVVWVWIGVAPGSDEPTALPPAGDPSVATLSPSESPSESTPPSASPSDRPSPSASTSASPTAKPTKTRKTPTTEPARNVPVVVFNQTPEPGLAARFAARLELAGWNVVGVDNWVGTVPATTVYYRPGDRAAARALTADFPDVGRIMPAVANMPSGALTVVITSDFPTG